MICKNYDELQQQFVLIIKSARPPPKTLIDELLPTVEGVPVRHAAWRFAAGLVDRANFSAGRAQCREIRQHTNTRGAISDTAMRKLVMNSAAHGAIREPIQHEDRDERAFRLTDEFFDAVADVFGGEWTGMSPRSSRLRHSAVIVSMGIVMDLLVPSQGTRLKDDFVQALELLKPFSARMSTIWRLDGYELAWNHIRYTPNDVDILTRHLVFATKRELRKMRPAVNA